MKYNVLKAGLISATLIFSMLSHAAEQSLDKVSVIVDQGVILESEIVELVDGGTINYPLQDNYHRIKESYNPQANSVLTRIHETIGNMIHTFKLHSSEIDEEDRRLEF